MLLATLHGCSASYQAYVWKARAFAIDVPQASCASRCDHASTISGQQLMILTPTCICAEQSTCVLFSLWTQPAAMAHDTHLPPKHHCSPHPPASYLQPCGVGTFSASACDSCFESKLAAHKENMQQLGLAQHGSACPSQHSAWPS